MKLYERLVDLSQPNWSLHTYQVHVRKLEYGVTNSARNDKERGYHSGGASRVGLTRSTLFRLKRCLQTGFIPEG